MDYISYSRRLDVFYLIVDSLTPLKETQTIQRFMALGSQGAHFLMYFIVGIARCKSSSL